MDEPPFLDTDVGRASFLVTLEDFAIFVEEYQLPIGADELRALAASSVRYAAIELIEIGGDHLDRLAARRAALDLGGVRSTSAGPPYGGGLEAALRRSEALVRAAESTVYFVNGSALLAPLAAPAEPEAADSKPSDGLVPRLVLAPPAVAALVRRLRYLATVLPCGHRVVLSISRLPALAAPEEGGDGAREGGDGKGIGGSGDGVDADGMDGSALPGPALFDAVSVEASVAALRCARRLPLDARSLDARSLGARATMRASRKASRSELALETPPNAAPLDGRGARLLCAFLPELLSELLGRDDDGRETAATLRFDDDAELAACAADSGGDGGGGDGGDGEGGGDGGGGGAGGGDEVGWRDARRWQGWQAQGKERGTARKGVWEAW